MSLVLNGSARAHATNVVAASRVTRAAEGMDRRRFTVAEVEAMASAGILGGDERIELIGGELVPMCPKGSRHEILKVALLRRWFQSLLDDCELAPATTLRLSEDTFLEPDVVIYPRASGWAEFSAATALLIVEIADSSKRYDQGCKAAIYSGFGVRELWVIDAAAMTTRTHRAPSATGYTKIREFGGAETIVPQWAPVEFALALQKLPLA